MEFYVQALNSGDVLEGKLHVSEGRRVVEIRLYDERGNNGALEGLLNVF
jgi:hypothetical protein